MDEHDAACRCGHAKAAHEHYRRGSDCGLCGRELCRSFGRSEVSSVVPLHLPSIRVRRTVKAS